jgi:hypothetical protein
LVDQQYRRIPVIEGVAARHLDLERVVGAVAGLPHQLLGFGAVPGNVGAIARQCPQLTALSSGHVLTSRRRCRREGQHLTPLRVIFDDLLNVHDAAGLPVERAGMVTCQFMHGA